QPDLDKPGILRRADDLPRDSPALAHRRSVAIEPGRRGTGGSAVSQPDRRRRRAAVAHAPAAGALGRVAAIRPLDRRDRAVRAAADAYFTGLSGLLSGPADYAGARLFVVRSAQLAHLLARYEV